MSQSKRSIVLWVNEKQTNERTIRMKSNDAQERKWKEEKKKWSYAMARSQHTIKANNSLWEDILFRYWLQRCFRLQFWLDLECLIFGEWSLSVAGECSGDNPVETVSRTLSVYALDDYAFRNAPNRCIVRSVQQKVYVSVFLKTNRACPVYDYCLYQKPFLFSHLRPCLANTIVC